MKLFLTDQAKRFERLLADLIQRPVMKYDRSKLREQKTSISIPTTKPLEELNLDLLFAYKIFPPYIMTHLTQWGREKRKMRVGDTILQQVFIPPISAISQKLIFGVRVNNVTIEKNRKGFSYETLEGHVERGESSFMIENLGNSIVFSITTFSEPSNAMLKMAGPLLAVPYQAYCTRKALENVCEQLERSGTN